MDKNKIERGEALMRIVVGIISGVILEIWSMLVAVLAILNWLFALFFGKRHKEMARLSEIWNSQNYDYIRYLVGVSNKRPFPFSDLKKNISKFE